MNRGSNPIVVRFAAGGRIELGEADAQSAASRKQAGKVRRIDLRQIPEDVEQSAECSGNRKVHALPDDRLRLGIRVDVPAVVQDLHHPDPRRVESLGHAQRVIVPPFLDLVALERRTNEDRNHELPLLTRQLRERKHRAGAGSFSTGTDDDDDRMPAQDGLDILTGLFQRLQRELRVVHRALTPRGVRTDDQALFLRDIGQREFIRIQEPRADGSPEPLRVSRIGLLRDDQIPAEHGLQRAENVAAAATRAEKKNIHDAPSCCLLVSKRNGMTTHGPSARRGPLMNGSSPRTRSTRSTSYSTFFR